MDNRREHSRHALWFPIEISSESGGATAISYDVSSGGLLMACPGRLEAGALVTVTFRLLASAPEQEVRGRVVRIEENPAARGGPWRWRMAVEFDAPVPELASLLATSAAPIVR